jgi:hypothetical protein
MGGILGGALGGFASEALDMKKGGKRGLLRGKKKTSPAPGPMADPLEYKKGGRVKKGGWAKVHAGEKVIPKRKRGR